MPHTDTAIILFAYKRPDHVKRVFESLLANRNIHRYHIIVVQDGARNEDEQILTETTSRVINENLKNFSSSEAINATKNLGLAGSIISGINYAFTKYEKCIVLEDDILVHPEFVNYMQELLDVYEDKEEIGSITGFQLVNRGLRKKTRIYSSNRHSSWGWATWRRVWKDVDWKILETVEINNPKIAKMLSKGGGDLSGMLDLVKRGEIDSWSVLFDLNMILRNLYCIHPVQQLCVNIGMDGSGTNYSNVRYKSPFGRYFGKFEKLPTELQLKKSLVYDLQVRWRFSKLKANYPLILTLAILRSAKMIHGESLRNR